MIFTGIGSRETPKEILQKMFWIGEILCIEEWTLRSGAAPGADSAFEAGYAACTLWGEAKIQSVAEIYLPWKSFQSDERSWIEPKLTEPQPEAYEIAARFHPRWTYLSYGAKALHARNVHQVLGPDVANPIFSDCVICWTKDAKGGGGTGQALRIAEHYEISIYDLADPEQLADVCSELQIRL